MDGLPMELAKLCDLASLAECGDHVWAAVPALGVFTALFVPFKARWAGKKRGANLDPLKPVPGT